MFSWRWYACVKKGAAGRVGRAGVGGGGGGGIGGGGGGGGGTLVMWQSGNGWGQQAGALGRRRHHPCMRASSHPSMHPFIHPFAYPSLCTSIGSSKAQASLTLLPTTPNPSINETPLEAALPPNTNPFMRKSFNKPSRNLSINPNQPFRKPIYRPFHNLP